MQYVAKLIEDLTADLPYVQNRQLHSIFIGGGTPSLMSAKAYEVLFEKVFQLIPPKNNIEITLEANPGTVEQQRFKDYRSMGINRLSIGCQSFNAEHLKKLGRIHSKDQAMHAAESAQRAGFDNFNLDLMFALPKQTVNEALEDLETALSLKPTHLSWYQLTLEPNTIFHKYPPALPKEDIVIDMMQQGKDLLSQHHFEQYEVSAYAQGKQFCQHNLNYWRFGDYLGIGAGAHGKITQLDSHKIIRTTKYKQPKSYLSNELSLVEKTSVDKKERPFEFMLNSLRLQEPISFELFEQRTGLNKNRLLPILQQAQAKELIQFDSKTFQPTTLGRQFLNDLVAMFLG